MDMKVTTLADKAMLVKLTMRRANLTRRDAEAEAVIQSTLDDASLTVNSKLFRDKHNPINQIMTAASETYTYHKKWTLPYIDKGPRILPNARYMDYTAEMRHRIAVVDKLLNECMPKYDDYVQLDIAFRSRSPNSRAKVEDYPTATEFQSRMGFDLRFSPLPEARHFLFDIDDHDLTAFNDALHQAEKLARTDAIKRMLEPLQHLTDKLNKPIGTEGAIFRDSAVENIIEGIDIARKLCLDDSPEVKALTNELTQEIAKYGTVIHQLRESPIVRERAAAKLNDIANAMGAFMGSV